MTDIDINSRGLNSLTASGDRRDHLLAPPAVKSVYAIIMEVAAKHGLTYTEMLSARRAGRLARARQEAYWRCTKETLASLPTIGRHFGNRDHTTILKGARVHEQRLAQAPAQPEQARAQEPGDARTEVQAEAVESPLAERPLLERALPERATP